MRPSFLRMVPKAAGMESLDMASSDTWRMRVASRGQRKMSAMNSAQAEAPR